MSTKLSDIKGIYRCADINGNKRLKFMYFGKINNYTDSSSKNIKLYSIPNTLGACHLGMMTVDDSATYTDNITYNDNTYIDSTLKFATFDVMTQRPAVRGDDHYYEYQSATGNYVINSRRLSSSSFFMSVIFKADLSDVTSNDVLLMYEPTNNILRPIRLTSSTVLNLGDDIHSLSFPNDFTLNASTPPYTEFTFPKFAFATYNGSKYVPIDTTFTLYDIAICFIYR